MAQQDPTAPGREATADVMASAMDACNAASKNIQAIASEIFDISKQSFEHTTQTMEKLRNARGVEEVAAIQTAYIKEAFEHAAKHAQKFSALMAAFPAEMTKTCQDAWLKSVNSTVKATETAGQAAVENIDRLSEAARKVPNVFDRRESA
jgi:hypothetical protein